MYHSVDGGLSLPFLQGFPGLLPAADLLWRQAQQPAHLFPEEVAVAIINRPVISQDLHSRHLIALKGEQDCLNFISGLAASSLRFREFYVPQVECAMQC